MGQIACVHMKKKGQLSQCVLALSIVSYTLGLSLGYSIVKHQGNI